MSGRVDAILRGELPPNHPFRTMTNVLATPHIGYVSRRLYETFYRDTVANIEALARRISNRMDASTVSPPGLVPMELS
jgi:phosphoglycerate dehydrogenase-like enzyme